MLFLFSVWCFFACPTAQPQADNPPTSRERASSVTEIIGAQQPVMVKLFGAGAGTLDSYGTGVLVSPEGHLITVWNHLVTTGYLTAVTADGRRFSVETLGTSAEHDLALLRLKAGEKDAFPCIDLSRAADPEPGTSVLAFSNMFRVAAGNEPVSVVHGVIAARVPLEATQGRWKFPVKSPVLLIDAITNNSGAAGGLLTDLEGRPIGLIGREIRHAASRTWVNYAVPFSSLTTVINTLKSGKRVEQTTKDSEKEEPRLSDQELTARFGLTLLPNVVERTPAFVDDVVAGSNAQQGGFRRGDLIVLVDSAVVTSVTDVQKQLAAFRSGQTVAVTVNREDQLVTLDLKIP